MQTLRLDKCQMEKNMRRKAQSGWLTGVEVHPCDLFKRLRSTCQQAVKSSLKPVCMTGRRRKQGPWKFHCTRSGS